jgi:hypothetical protein
VRVASGRKARAEQEIELGLCKTEGPRGACAKPDASRADFSLEHLMKTQNEREANLLALADRLEFSVEKTGDRFKLTRTAAVSRPVCEAELTLAEAEELLSTWKLRGLGGG